MHVFVRNSVFTPRDVESLIGTLLIARACESDQLTKFKADLALTLTLTLTLTLSPKP